MTRSARSYVNSLLKNSQSDTNTCPNTTQPTVRVLVSICIRLLTIGLYDYPPDDPRSREHVTGRRNSRSTERNIHYRTTRDTSEQRRRRSLDTRAKNASLRRARVEDPAIEARTSTSAPGESDPLNTEEIGSNAQRGRSRAIRPLSRSASPGSTDCENERPTQVPDESQYTYIYETLDHEGLVDCAQKEFGLDVRGCGTQEIIDRLRLAATEQAAHMGPSRRSASIIVLPSTPFQVGGGWSQDVVGSKRPMHSPTGDLSEGSSKRQRIETAVDDDTATESESDNEAMNDAASAPQGLGNPSQDPLSACEANATAIPDPQLPNASPKLLGGLLRPSPPRFPRLRAPICGPTHARLRTKLVDRALHDAGVQVVQAPSPTTNNQGDLNGVPEPELGTSGDLPQPRLRTYHGHRSHIPSNPDSIVAEVTDTEHTMGAANPSCANPTPSQVIQSERARAVAAKAHEEMSEVPPRRRPLFAAASHPPASRPQSRPAPRGSTSTIQRLGGTSRRLDPVSAAREDMLAFNEAVARGEATSLVESVTRQSQRTARCVPPESRRADDLLDDDEEDLAQAEAYAKRKWPRRPGRVRKPKPLARDVSGLARQVLIMAKIHLFAYALVEGVYQTRATYLRWAALIHQATWEMDLPDHPYERPDDSIFEIMVNSIATSRGKVKERLREFVARVSGFRHTTTNQKVIETNLVRFNRLYPNTFHCKTVTPRSGDYESPEIGHCIALAVFSGPNSVGVLYPDYFQEMPLTVVAFALAIWQFCIEEWANGWRQNGDLGMAAMREKYEAQLAGLKDLREIAPRRMYRLQNQWRDYVVEYSGASFEPESSPPSMRKSQMRPDTPEPNAISVEEMEDRLFETARQNSLHSNISALAAEELAQPIDIDIASDSDGSRASTPPPVEYNEYGMLTAHAKGKGRAN